MNEYITNQTQHFTGSASLAAIGVKLDQLKLFEPIRNLVQVKQKTIKYTPVDKLYDAFISLLAGAHGLVEINTRLRSDPGLSLAFGRSACAEQSVVQETLNACTTENVVQLQHALDEIYRQQSQSIHHDSRANWLLLDVDMSGMPCGRHPPLSRAFGYFAGQYHRRGRQLGRVLATQYEEVVVDRLFAGNVQLVKALQPLVQAAESTLQPYREETSTDDCARGRWGRNCRRPQLALFRVVMRLRLKSMEARRVLRLAKTVAEWVQDPDWSERSFGWVTEPPTDYVRPVKRIVVRCQRQDGTYAYGILICSLSDEQVLAVLKRPRTLLSDPTAILTAYVNFYDQRGGGIETSGLR